MGYLKDLTNHMARAVVSEPDEVRVEEVEGSSMVVIELSVASIDMGRIIGKEGRVANAMRTLLRTSAAKDGKRVSLEII
ncbi:KH domain-containing protein [Anaerolineales bacterium HSG24]|nr:KH domain-containing protein [Anaerolineales bacterium HSG24]